MKITDKLCFDEYMQLIGNDLQRRVEKFLLTKQNYDLRYQIQASAVYSSNIEGNTIDLNTFMNYKQFKTKAKPQKEL